METSEILETIEVLHSDARRRGLFFQTCEDESLRARRITMQGRELLSFGSCSYLSLEYHPKLIACAHEMLDRYGTQHASSRGYMSAPPYPELEETLSRIFDGHAVTCQTTTLAHQAAFDVLLTERDAIVLDHQVHFSVQRAATLSQAGGATVELVRHEELERAVDVVRALADKHRTVWFATDGITSMYGDLAPVELLHELLDVADNVRLYVDDAHGMSWCGERGRGSILSRFPLSERIVVATSLAKAFGAGGAALVFADPGEKERVRLCGGPMVFSGPLQPPLLGAALASARLHLTDELPALQAALADRVQYANQRVIEARLPLLVDNEVPILFIRCGLPRVAAEVAQRLREDGIYVNVSMFPSVPMRRAGIRCGITVSHTRDDIDRLVEALERHLPKVLAEEGLSRVELDRLFEKTAIGKRYGESRAGLAALVASHAGSARGRRGSGTRRKTDIGEVQLVVERSTSIDDVDAAEWDRLLGDRAHCSAEAMRTAERVFCAERDRPEHRWSFDYVIVRDANGRPVAATAFTTSLQKDDMLMRSRISDAVEARRVEDPYFLTSRVTQAGSGLSEGDHVFLDRTGPWRAALRRLVQVGHNVQRERGADMLTLRDLDATDEELADAMLEEGLLAVPMPPTHEIAVTWADDEDLVRQLPSKRKRRVARDVVESASAFDVTVYDGAVPDASALHRLYLNVAEKGRRLNAFHLPEDVFEQLAASSAWEIGVLTLRGEPAPVACWAAHACGRSYAPLIAGLDYAYVESMKTYKQLLFQILRRARALDMERVRLGMTADQEKERWGSTKHEVSAYVQSDGAYNASLLRQIVAEVGLAA